MAALKVADYTKEPTAGLDTAKAVRAPVPEMGPLSSSSDDESDKEQEKKKEKEKEKEEGGAA